MPDASAVIDIGVMGFVIGVTGWPVIGVFVTEGFDG